MERRRARSVVPSTSGRRSLPIASCALRFAGQQVVRATRRWSTGARACAGYLGNAGITEHRQPGGEGMGADAAGAARFGAGAAHLDVGDAIGEGDLRVIDFFVALDLRADDVAFAMGIFDTASLDQPARFLERGPAADFGEKIVRQFQRCHDAIMSQNLRSPVSLVGLFGLDRLKR